MGTLDYQNRDDSKKEKEASGGLLRALFGPSKEEVWRQLAEQIDAAYVGGGFGRADKVVAEVGPWAVTLDTFTESSGEHRTTYTRLRAPYVNRDGFRFKVYRAGFFTSVGKMLGMQDIEVGNAAFDEAFVVQGNDEAKAKALLADGEVRRLIAAQPRIRLEVRDDEGWFGKHFPEGVDELYFAAAGVIKDVDRLRQLFDLFALVLHRLCHLGSAYETDPGISL